MTRSRTPLVDGWQLTRVGGEPAHRAPALPDSIQATVPGTVHTDLLAAGLIPDPYLDTNELTLDWIGHQQWSYRTTFDWPPAGAGAGSRTDLVCDGLDTVATVLVNGTEVGRFANQHRSYRIPLDHVLRPGTNDLEVVFDSAWEYAAAVRDQVGDRPNAYPTPFQFIRKMACNFGWDWGPTLVTAGIWRPIALETWETARLAGVRPHVTVDGAAGLVRMEVDIERGAGQDGQLTLVAQVGDAHGTVVIAAGSISGAVDLEVPQVQLWWPHDLGSQPLYDITLALFATPDSTTALDSWSRRVGFRTIELDTSADDIGSAFTLRVNGVPIFARGANWIPDDCFPSRVTSARLRERIGQGIGAHLNLLRIWGGGLFESEEFYDLCDELGVLVWQDFLFACSAYPEEEPIRSEVVAEARENVQRLMPHASLALWNGCNENIWGYFDWDWQEPLAGRTWGAGYYFDLLPVIVSQIDPTRPYYPGSPFSGSMDLHPNDDRYGLMHMWDVWNEVDYTAYRDHRPRFAAEFGYQGPPTMPTLTRSIHDDPLRPDSPGMLHHQKAEDGNGKLTRGAKPHLPPSQSFEDWHYLMQLNQSEAVRFGVEHLRSYRGRCMGAVVWQLNDCWPVTSWAAVDGDGRRKLLWYGLREANADRLLTIQPRDGRPMLFGVNDAGSAWRGPVVVRRITFDGVELATFTATLRLDRLSSTSAALPDEIVTAADPSGEVVVAQAATGERALWFFAEDRELALTDPGLRVESVATAHGVDITVSAAILARHVVVLADRAHPDAWVEDGAVTILPGRSHTFRVHTPAPLGSDAEIASWVRTLTSFPAR